MSRSRNTQTNTNVQRPCSARKHKWRVNNSNFPLFWLAAIFNYDSLMKKLRESYETLRWVSRINLRRS